MLVFLTVLLEAALLAGFGLLTKLVIARTLAR